MGAFSRMPISRHLLNRSGSVRSIFSLNTNATNSRTYSTRPLSVLLDIPPLEPRKKLNHKHRRLRSPQSPRQLIPLPSQSVAVQAAERKPTRTANRIELFDAIVHQGVSVKKLRGELFESCVLPDGNAVPLRLDEEFAKKLKVAFEEKNAVIACKLMNKIQELGYKPTSAAYLKALETCTAAGSLDEAEDIMENHTPHIRMYEREADVNRSARTSLALAYLARDNPKSALRILRWDGMKQLESMELGKCEMAWGCLIRALTKSGDGETAISVAHSAFDAGTTMTNSVLFFMLEAFRECGRWQDADTLLRSVQERGIVGGTESMTRSEELIEERSVGSLLRTITSPAARRFVDSKRVVELATNVIKEPSSRFRTVALIALSSIGETKEARQIYDGLLKDAYPNTPDERALSILIGGYCARIERGPPDDSNIEQWYKEICEEVDELWKMFQSLASITTQPRRREKEARSRAFQRVLWAKSRALQVSDATEQLAKIAREMKDEFNIGTAHFAAVLTGTELTCDVDTLRKVLELMEIEYIPHDPRTLAFSVGCLLGGGDVYAAVALVREQSDYLLHATRLAEQRDYRIALLVRRLEMLVYALAEKHDLVAKKEIEDIAREFKRHLELHKGPTRGWR